MSMSSTFTTANRGKKIATYGKSSRPASNFSWNDDAPSPERPHKQASQSNGILKKPAGGLGGRNVSGSTRPNPRKPPVTQGIFDVPSDNTRDPLSLAPTKKPATKPAASRNEFDFPSSGDEAPAPRRRVGRTPQPLPSREPEAGKLSTTFKKKLQRTESAGTTSSDDPLAPPRRQARPQHISQKLESSGGNQLQAKRPAVKPKAGSRATTPAPSAATTQKIKSVAKLPSKKPAEKAQFKTSALDVFDVPLSDEDAPRTSKKTRPTPLSRPKSPPHARNDSPEPLTEDTVDSDDSNASRKRKRQGSMSSITTANGIGVVGKKKELTVLQRSRKYQRKEDSISPGHDTSAFPKPLPLLQGGLSETSINKPKRTRGRTTGPPRTQITKGQSSPAKLHGMLAVRSLAQPSPVIEVAEEPILEDETMYDIVDSITPLARPGKATVAGSVTPRQKTIFNNLLGDSAESTTLGMPSISRLQLTDRRPRSLIAGLSRSSSDIPGSAYSRKARLIDTLRQATLSSDEDSETDEETEEDITEIPATSGPTQKNTYGERNSSGSVADEMEVEEDAQIDSHASQSSIHLNIGTKVTYAKQRSYLEEANPEDGLLMDLDDMLGFGGVDSNKMNEILSEDEDDPASQVRGIHELRRQGQNQKFQMEAQASIDDIAGKGGMGPSVRRIAMLEFCTRLADPDFVGQLLDSALGQQFFHNIASKGEIIFDFAATAAVAFILNSGPGYSILEEIQQSSFIETLIKLLDLDTDIRRIAKERKTNMSKIGQESVADASRLVRESSMWSSETLDKISPQLMAAKALELLVLGLRRSGSTEALLGEDVVVKLLNMASSPCDRLSAGKATSQDLMTINITFSILEAVSISKEKQATWPNEILRRLVIMMPSLFEAGGASTIKLAIRLCMNLTNNKPKACDTFAEPGFIGPLVRSISHRFILLASEHEEGPRNELLECLILSLGAIINLAEFSDRVRASVVADGDELIDALVKIFLDGSERAAQADSMEESQSSVTVGYLTVLLGNLCLNNSVRRKVRSRLPGNDMNVLIDKIKEFVRYNERVDRETNQFEGEEGRETWRNFTMRLLLVVERLEKAKG